MSEMVRVVLIRHAPTAATLRGAFPGDEPLDDVGRRRSAALRGRLPEADEVVSSPARRCLETAAAAGLQPAVVARLAECDFGSWAGRTLSEIDPDLAGRWMGDWESHPPGGESFASLHERVAGWLEEQHRPGCMLAFTHAGVIKAAITHALGVAPAAAWRIAHAPLAITELHRHDGAWSVACVNCPAGAPA